jgi:hypothetical protein
MRNILNFYSTSSLQAQYETTKSNGITFMKSGQISAYLNSLIAMNTYKRLIMIAVISN